MVKNVVEKSDIKEGLAAGFPIVIGLIPIALTFGILSKTSGISLLHCLLFSAVVFAGASQFIALSLLSIGAGFGEIILTTLLINFRHFLMSASLATRITEDLRKYIPFIAYNVTDESFTVASFRKGPLTKEFLIPMQAIVYLSWSTFSVLGYWLGEFMPAVIKDSMTVAIYAMFASLLIPEAKKSRKVLMLAVLSGMTNTLLNALHVLPKGWSMIITIVLISGIGAYLYEEKEGEAHDQSNAVE
jgi:4-azaleucine resistance transporter AzlC